MALLSAFLPPHSGAGEAKRKVLIVYYSGSATKGQRPPPLEKGPVDALTYATPAIGGVEYLARKVAERLQEAGLEVEVRRVEECMDPRKFVEADAILIGTPTYFSGMAWQVKRLFDICFYRLFVYRRLSDKVASAFVSAAVLRDGKICLATLKAGMRHLRPRWVEGLAVTPRTPQSQIDAQCREFADRILEALRMSP